MLKYSAFICAGASNHSWNLWLWVSMLWQHGLLVSVLQSAAHSASELRRNGWPWFQICLWIFSLTGTVPECQHLSQMSVKLRSDSRICCVKGLIVKCFVDLQQGSLRPSTLEQSLTPRVSDGVRRDVEVQEPVESTTPQHTGDHIITATPYQRLHNLSF